MSRGEGLLIILWFYQNMYISTLFIFITCLLWLFLPSPHFSLLLKLVRVAKSHTDIKVRFTNLSTIYMGAKLWNNFSFNRRMWMVSAHQKKGGAFHMIHFFNTIIITKHVFTWNVYVCYIRANWTPCAVFQCTTIMLTPAVR